MLTTNASHNIADDNNGYKPARLKKKDEKTIIALLGIDPTKVNNVSAMMKDQYDIVGVEVTVQSGYTTYTMGWSDAYGEYYWMTVDANIPLPITGSIKISDSVSYDSCHPWVERHLTIHSVIVGGEFINKIVLPFHHFETSREDGRNDVQVSVQGTRLPISQPVRELLNKTPRAYDAEKAWLLAVAEIATIVLRAQKSTVRPARVCHETGIENVKPRALGS